MARIYSESLKKWGKGIGLVGVVGGMFTLLFMFLSSSGLITVISHSGDVACAGTELNPCYAEITFKANEDIYVYALGYDPWGRNETFQFNPAVKEWKLQRSWGGGWRDYDLENPCTGTWCGASSSNSNVQYSLVWRKGREYTIRIVALKNNPSDKIKWSVFEGNIDPFWLPLSKLQVEVFNKQLNHTETWEEKKDIYWSDPHCSYIGFNDTYYSCNKYNKTETTIKSKFIIDLEYQELSINGSLINSSDLGLWCWNDGKSKIWCNSYVDGIAKYKKKQIIKGTSYCFIDYSTGKLDCKDFLKSKLQNDLKKRIEK